MVEAEVYRSFLEIDTEEEIDQVLRGSRLYARANAENIYNQMLSHARELIIIDGLVESGAIGEEVAIAAKGVALKEAVTNGLKNRSVWESGLTFLDCLLRYSKKGKMEERLSRVNEWEIEKKS